MYGSRHRVGGHEKGVICVWKMVELLLMVVWKKPASHSQTQSGPRVLARARTTHSRSRSCVIVKQKGALLR